MLGKRPEIFTGQYHKQRRKVAESKVAAEPGVVAGEIRMN